MKRLLPLLVTSLLLTACARPMSGTFFLFGFRDMVSYVGFALVISVIVGVLSEENWRRAFWISFILSLLLTPLAGLIYCLILLTRR